MTTLQEYIAQELERDPEFADEWDRSRPVREIHSAIVGARIAAGLSQRELAERMGVSQPVVARLEAGDFAPRIETVQRVATALGVTFQITIPPLQQQRPVKRRSSRTA